uniref:Uncharacterized protein n=1 Tax=Heliothis virescens TaxID=7102 RepID=A0A2A4JW57_HELVI
MTQTKILFYRNRKNGPSNVILHKSEWNRLKKQGGPPEKPLQLQNEYLNSLIEKSQGWIKTWPDTEQGCVALLEKQKEKRRSQDIATAEAFAKKDLKNTKHLKEAIEKARQKIFDESCYGKKLISALRESKTLEEREAQIKFQKEIKEKASKLEEKKFKTVTFCTFDLDKNAAATKEQQKYITIETSKQNKDVHEKQKKDQAKAKEQERLAALNDAQQMKYLLDREQEAEDKIKLLEKQALEQYVSENKKTKEERAKWEAEYYAKIDACRKQQEDLNAKIRQVHLRGCVALLEKQKEKRRSQDIATAEAFAKKDLKNTKHLKEAIEKARQKIFDESCYGKKLISALRESKTLEEREAQIKFQKEIKEKASKLEEKKFKTVTFCTFDLDKNAAATKEQQKYITIETSKQNKDVHEKQKKDQAKAKEQERLAALNDAQQMKYLLDREQEAEDKIKLLEKQALEQYVSENKKTKEERAKWEAEYYAKIDACRKQQEDLNAKIRQVHLRIHKKNQESALFKNNFEAIKKCQEEENKRLDDFIERSLIKGEQRAAKRDRRAKDKIMQDRKNKMSIATVNKTMSEYVKLMECNSKCFCDRQCIITKSDIPRVVKKREAEIEPEKTKETVSYFGPSNKLVDALRRREQDPKPWTGAGAADELFVKNADRTLQEVKYKLPARKVVDEYRKYNALNETTLPIRHYN